MLLLLLRLGPDLYLCAASSSTESLLGRSLGTYMISIYFLRAGSENQMNICKFVLTLALDQACSAFVSATLVRSAFFVQIRNTTSTMFSTSLQHIYCYLSLRNSEEDRCARMANKKGLPTVLRHGRTLWARRYRRPVRQLKFLPEWD